MAANEDADFCRWGARTARSIKAILKTTQHKVLKHYTEDKFTITLRTTQLPKGQSLIPKHLDRPT